MSTKSGAKTRTRKKNGAKLRASAVPARETWMIPKSWLNTVIGFFLLPPAWISTLTFFTCFRIATVHHRFWASEEFWFFCLGVVMWLVVFFSLPRPLLIYVFGHELTHALWVWVMGGRVSAFRVSRTGGHIITDTHNFWIALTPYFFPLYSIIVIAGFGAAGLFTSMTRYHELLYALIGVTWAFHISFTLWMIPKGQTDLTYYGTFFSLVIIYVMNLAVLTLLLIVATPHVTWRMFGTEWLRHAHEFAQWVLVMAGRIREVAGKG